MSDSSIFLFFFNDTATTEIYTLSLHDALPILRAARAVHDHPDRGVGDPRRAAGQHGVRRHQLRADQDRKSTRLNSSHSQISYAVFCLKKKKKKNKIYINYIDKYPNPNRPWTNT